MLASGRVGAMQYSRTNPGLLTAWMPVFMMGALSSCVQVHSEGLAVESSTTTELGESSSATEVETTTQEVETSSAVVDKTTSTPQEPEGPKCPWIGQGAPIEQRLAMLMDRMTLDDKLAMVHGSAKALEPYGPEYAGQIAGNKELCIPALSFSDGPAGVGNEARHVTQFPAPIAVGATFDRELAMAFGKAMGKENREKGAHVLLGPGLDVIRDPRWGRAFESFGEDPELVADMGVQVMQGIQAEGSLATAKHFAVYTQETGRNTITSDAQIELRPMHEIYLLPFFKNVKAGVSSVMCGYNPVNGVYACNHGYLMNQVLKGQMGFEGFVVSDWFGVHASFSSVNAGLDLQMPDMCFFDARLRTALKEGDVEVSRVDDMVRRILLPMFRYGFFDQPGPHGDKEAVVNSEAHAKLATTLAARGMVLLKNENELLPILADKVESIALIGEAAEAKIVTSGGGSAHVVADRVVTPLQGLTRRAMAEGIELSFHDGALHGPAADLAKEADLAIVVVRHHKTESKDDANLMMRWWDKQLIQRVVSANPNTLVVLNTGSVVDPGFDPGIPGLLAAWYPGQGYGEALAQVLFGDVDPSGRLPVTVPLRERDMPTEEPGRNYPGGAHSEGLEVGYRSYDARDLEVAYPFGFGLSYTQFVYRDLAVKSDGAGGFGVSFWVENVGTRKGRAVPQLYVDSALEGDAVPRGLKDFASVEIEAGSGARVELKLEGLDLSYFDEGAQRWRQDGGTRQIWVGDSSRALRLEAAVEVEGTGWTSAAVPGVKAGQEVGNAGLREAAGDRLGCPNEGFMAWGLGIASFFGLEEKPMAWEGVGE